MRDERSWTPFHVLGQFLVNSLLFPIPPLICLSGFRSSWSCFFVWDDSEEMSTPSSIPPYWHDHFCEKTRWMILYSPWFCYVLWFDVLLFLHCAWTLLFLLSPVNLLWLSCSGCSASPQCCSLGLSVFMLCMNRWWLLPLFLLCTTKNQPSIAVICLGLKYPVTHHS